MSKRPANSACPRPITCCRNCELIACRPGTPAGAITRKKPEENFMGADAPSDKPKSPVTGSEDVTEHTKTRWSEAQKHPKTAAAHGLRLEPVADAVLLASRKPRDDHNLPQTNKHKQ